MRHIGFARLLAGLVIAGAICALGPAAAHAQGKSTAPDEAAALNRQIEALQKSGRYADAVPLAQRALELARAAKGPDHPDVATALNRLAALYRVTNRTGDARPLLERALVIRETKLGRNHVDVAETLNDIALIDSHSGRYAEAEAAYKRAIAIRTATQGPASIHLAVVMGNLASLYMETGRFRDAEPMMRQSLTLREAALGPDNLDVSFSLNSLAALYRHLGRSAEAEPLLRRCIEIRQKAVGPNHELVANALSNLGEVLRTLGRLADAEPYLRRSLTIREGLPNTDPLGVAQSLNNLAGLLVSQGRPAEAEPLFARSLQIREANLGPDHVDVGTLYRNLAEVRWLQGRYADAMPFFKRSLDIRQKGLGPDHPLVGAALNNVALVSFAQRQWQPAMDFWRQSTAVAIRSERRGTLSPGPANDDGRDDGLAHARGEFQGLVKTAHQLALASGAQPAALREESFVAAQRAQWSAAAASLAKMALRGASGNAALGALVRERQDLAAEWARRDADQIAAIARPGPARNTAAEAANSERQKAIDGRLAAIDTRLRTEFPQYAALSRPEPLSLDQVQSLLRDDEALVLFLETGETKPVPEETFVWAVSKTTARWVRSALGTKALADEVAALRCGLDATAWRREGRSRCASLIGIDVSKAPVEGAPLPFDTRRAHALYAALFGGIGDVIAGKHLLLVPSGALAQLPFQVLVTAEPRGTGYADAAWLARAHAMTVLPAVSSLAALRRVSKPSAATLSMIGFGNPTLDGDPRTARDRLRAAAAAYRQSCALPLSDEEQVLQSAAGIEAQLIAGQLGAGQLVAGLGSGVTAAAVRRLDPVPGTARLLCDLADEADFPANAVHLGRAATKLKVKQMSRAGELARYRVVHFATHGLLPGQAKASTEPGLVLTPTEGDGDDANGYLTASEIAELKLDADAVVLSACNTAGAGDSDGQALSGLARAFLYAQARSLMVSHWEVAEEAAVELISSTLKTAQQTGVGLAAAQRAAILDLVGRGGPQRTHPAFWAPFVVVGEGATRP